MKMNGMGGGRGGGHLRSFFNGLGGGWETNGAGRRRCGEENTEKPLGGGWYVDSSDQWVNKRADRVDV